MRFPFNRVRALGVATALLGCGFQGAALAVGSVADIQVVDRAQNRVLPVYWHDGKAYVVGEPGSEYQVRLTSKTVGDILAVVSVDGVNVISGETAAPEQTGYVLSRWQRYDIKGWRKSLDRTAAFYFTQLPDSYAARTGRPDNVGVIGVAVFRRKPAEPVAVYPDYRRDLQTRNEDRAGDYSRESSGSSAELASRPAAPSANTAQRSLAQPTPEKSLGTGHGRNETSVVRNVEFERASPMPDEVITVYYDSRRNLMARGILPSPPVAQPRPQPFPGRFVADPPRS